jgi:hypothetical protein
MSNLQLCGFCGDLAGREPRIVNSKPACKECALELTTGKIPGPEKITGTKARVSNAAFFGKHIRSEHTTEAARENAIRSWEDG